MEETHAIIGILLLSAIAFTSYFVLTADTTGAFYEGPYVTCCCNILAEDGSQQVLFRSQVQSTDPTCDVACLRYSKDGHVFAQNGLCAMNP